MPCSPFAYRIRATRFRRSSQFSKIATIRKNDSFAVANSCAVCRIRRSPNRISPASSLALHVSFLPFCRGSKSHTAAAAHDPSARSPNPARNVNRCDSSNGNPPQIPYESARSMASCAASRLATSGGRWTICGSSTPSLTSSSDFVGNRALLGTAQRGQVLYHGPQLTGDLRLHRKISPLERGDQAGTEQLEVLTLGHL
jgi:hypothetical protein